MTRTRPTLGPYDDRPGHDAAFAEVRPETLEGGAAYFERLAVETFAHAKTAPSVATLVAADHNSHDRDVAEDDDGGGGREDGGGAVVVQLPVRRPLYALAEAA